MMGTLVIKTNTKKETVLTLQHPTATYGQEQEIKSVSGGGTVMRQGKKIGRNDPCWCGSGKKWKKYHYPNQGPNA